MANTTYLIAATIGMSADIAVQSCVVERWLDGVKDTELTPTLVGGTYAARQYQVTDTVDDDNHEVEWKYVMTDIYGNTGYASTVDAIPVAGSPTITWAQGLGTVDVSMPYTAWPKVRSYTIAVSNEGTTIDSVTVNNVNETAGTAMVTLTGPFTANVTYTFTYTITNHEGSATGTFTGTSSAASISFTNGAASFSTLTPEMDGSWSFSCNTPLSVSDLTITLTKAGLVNPVTVASQDITINSSDGNRSGTISFEHGDTYTAGETWTASVAAFGTSSTATATVPSNTITVTASDPVEQTL